MPLATTRRRVYRRAPGHENRSEHSGWSFRLRPCRRLCRPVYGAALGIGIADVAQSGRAPDLDPEVAGSNPPVCTTDSSVWLEHQIVNLTVEGSIPSPLAFQAKHHAGVI